MMASKLDFSPPLPAPPENALGVWQSGAVIKLLLRYATALLARQGPERHGDVARPAGLFACDASKDDGHPALVVFVGGPLAAALAGTRRCRHARRGDRDGCGGARRRGRRHLDFMLRDWTDDRWSGGGYSDLIIDTDATDAEAHPGRRAAGHFASSELSPSFPGYVEGAIVAGRIAARESDRSSAEALINPPSPPALRVVGEADRGADRNVVGAEIVGFRHRQRLFQSRYLDDQMGDLAEVMALDHLAGDLVFGRRVVPQDAQPFRPDAERGGLAIADKGLRLVGLDAAEAAACRRPSRRRSPRRSRP